MIVGYVLILGGLVQLGAGWYLSVATLAAVGALWTLAGAVNLTLARRAAAGPITRVSRDDLNNPAARARAYQSLHGAPVRGLIALACGAAALALGTLGIGFDATTSAWRSLPSIAGATAGGFALLGFFLYWASGVERTALTPATVVIRTFKDKTVNVSNSSLYVAFVLDVHPDGGAPYQTAMDSAVPIIAASHLAVGKRFPAQVAGPDKPKNVIVDWRAPIETAPAGPSAAAPVLGAPAAPPLAQAPGAPDGATRLRELN